MHWRISLLMRRSLINILIFNAVVDATMHTWSWLPVLFVSAIGSKLHPLRFDCSRNRFVPCFAFRLSLHSNTVGDFIPPVSNNKSLIRVCPITDSCCSQPRIKIKWPPLRIARRKALEALLKVMLHLLHMPRRCLDHRKLAHLRAQGGALNQHCQQAATTRAVADSRVTWVHSSLSSNACDQLK
jgi:hypothetical protein